ncbi:MAG: hypothetical protein M1820_009813 [Bogoriella megaspora]|nr:MAG: hypothetical protein M1820_009813 [Bogoriella megaspora]
MMDFQPLIEPSEKKPRFQFLNRGTRWNTLRDQFTITSWLCFGAILQLLAVSIIPIRYAMLPPILILTLYTLDTLLITLGLKSNPMLRGVIDRKFSAQLPDAHGNFGSKPASQPLVVFLLGARINHPLGMLAPGVKQLSEYGESMYAQLGPKSSEYGLLGQSFLTNNVSTSKNEFMALMYWRSVEDLHAYAHGPLHREAWDWWNKTQKQWPHIAIYHETYAVPAGAYETIYAHSKPTGLAAAVIEVEREKGKKEWVTPVVDCRKGVLKTSAGRMARSEGREHEGYLEAEYSEKV